MPEITWENDIPMPLAEEDYTAEFEESYEDSEWYNDPNCVMSRHHY